MKTKKNEKCEDKKIRFGYISDYYDNISSGKIIVGKHIKKQYEIIIKNLKEKKYIFDEKKAKRAIKFIETFCRHSEGNLGGELIKLELWQKAFLSCIFGIIDKEGFRQFREVVLVLGRKNGKTLLASAIATYIAYADGEYGGNILFCAPKIEQANLCYNGTFQMIDTDKELAKLAKKRRTDVYLKRTNTTIKPIAFNAKKSDGFNPSLCVCDEIASWPGANGLKQYEVMKSALGARKQPFILSISTAGYENDGIYDELIRRSMEVLNGTSKETRLAPFLYTIDDINKWNDIEELKKANPNMGVSVSEGFFRDEIAIAEGSFSKKSEMICKYCNIKQNSSSAWLDSETVKNCFGDELKIEEYKNSYAVVGVDLSQTTDLTAATCIIERKGHLYCFTHFWLPRARIEESIATDGVPYNIYIEKGWLSLSGDNMIDYRDVSSWILNLMRQHKIVPLIIGYDRYSSNYFVQELKDMKFRCESIIQGPNLQSSIDEVEGRMKDGTIHFGNNTLMRMHLLNTALKSNNEGKSQIVKLSKNDHIDGVASLLDAIASRRYFPEIKKQLENNR